LRAVEVCGILCMDLVLPALSNVFSIRGAF
jgi:hypothetical protein